MEPRDQYSKHTVDRIVGGYPYAQRFHGHGETPKRQLEPPHIPVSRNAFQERFYREELFLAGLLAHKYIERKEKVESFYSQVDWLLGRIPLDALAFQWLHNCTLSAETRAYLVEKLLPQVVIGLENILRDADKRGLCKEGNVHMDVNFNPLNRLAEFLMRNNPRYSNLSAATSLTPYSRGLRKVLDSLKNELFFSSDTELARLTAASDKRKADKDAEKEKAVKDLEDKTRKVEPLFDCFVIEGKDTANAIIASFPI